MRERGRERDRDGGREMEGQRWRDRDGGADMERQRWRGRYGETEMERQRWRDREGQRKIREIYQTQDSLQDTRFIARQTHHPE